MNTDTKNMKQKNKSITIILLILCFIVTFSIIVIVIYFATGEMRNYNKALEIYKSQNYNSAYDMFSELDNYEDSEKLAKLCDFYIKMNDYSKQGDYLSAITHIQDNENILDDEEYASILDEYRYLLAEQQYKSKDYISAYDNLVNNTYNKSASLLEKVEPLYNSEKSVDKILEEYQNMSDYLENSLDNKSYSEQSLLLATGVDWDMFYKNRGAVITNLENDLKSKSIDECSDDIEDIIGYIPETKEECNNIISELKEVFITRGGFKEYNGYFLYFIMEYITDDDKYLTITRDEFEGTITINQVDKYLKEKNISEKTFAYMLGVPTMYDMEIEKVDECLKLTFSKSSHNYAYCQMNDDEKLESELEDFFNKAFFDDIEYLYTSDGYDYYKLDLSGINKFNLDYLRCVFVSGETEDDSQILSQDHYFLEKEDLSKNNLTITIKFDTDSECIGYYFVGDSLI